MGIEPTSSRIIDIKGRLSYKIFTQIPRIADFTFNLVKRTIYEPESKVPEIDCWYHC